MGWTSPPTYADGDSFTAGDWNAYVVDNLQSCRGSAALRLTSTTTTSMSSGTETSQTFDQDIVNTEAGAHSPLSSSAQIVIQTPGLWSVTGTIEATHTSTFDAYLTLNGRTYLAETSSVVAASLLVTLNLHTVLPLRRGDQLSLHVLCGDTTTTSNGGEWTPLLTAVRVAAMYGHGDPEIEVG